MPLLGRARCDQLLGRGTLTSDMFCAGHVAGGQDTCSVSTRIIALLYMNLISRNIVHDNMRRIGCPWTCPFVGIDSGSNYDFKSRSADTAFVFLQ